MAKQDAEMKEASQKNDTESEEPQAEVSKEEKERLVLEGESKSGMLCFDIEGRFNRQKHVIILFSPMNFHITNGCFIKAPWFI